MAHPSQKQRRQSADGEHGAPTKFASDQKVGHRRKKNANVITGVHVPCARAAAVLRPFFGDERSTHCPLAADADACEKAKNSELPDIRNQGAEKREYGIPNDSEHQRSNAAKFVADRPPEEREAPSTKEQGEKQTTVISDVALHSSDAGTREEFSQRGHKHQCVDERVHTVERPPSPRSPEAANLISREWRDRYCWSFEMDAGGGHNSGDYIKSG